MRASLSLLILVVNTGVTIGFSPSSFELALKTLRQIFSEIGWVKDHGSRSISDAFREYRIVPQIIPVAPKTMLSEIFGNRPVVLGTQIPPWHTTTKPFVSWENVEEKALYTLIAIDPDYPKYFTNNNTQFLYGLVTNIPGSIIEKGDVLCTYVPSAPLAGSGDHRYITLIYKQQKPVSVTTELLIRVSTNPRKFSIAEFVDDLKLGNPVSGNFYLSRQELCEPIISKDFKCDCGCDTQQF